MTWEALVLIPNNKTEEKTPTVGRDHSVGLLYYFHTYFNYEGSKWYQANNFLVNCNEKHYLEMWNRISIVAITPVRNSASNMTGEKYLAHFSSEMRNSVQCISRCLLGLTCHNLYSFQCYYCQHYSTTTRVHR